MSPLVGEGWAVNAIVGSCNTTGVVQAAHEQAPKRQRECRAGALGQLQPRLPPQRDMWCVTGKPQALILSIDTEGRL